MLLVFINIAVLLSNRQSLIRSLETPDNFDQLHDRYWVHEMHADDLSGSLSRAGQVSDGN